MKQLLAGLLVVMVGLTWTQMAKGEDAMIEEGKTVKIDYKLTVEGDVIDSSEGKEPLQYVQGQNMIISGLEKELEGMKVGEEAKVTVKPEEGYGDVNPKLVVEVSKERLGEGIDPQVGMVLQMPTQEGQNVPGVITEVKDESLVLNFNHPLAGKELTFDVKVVGVE